MKCPPLQDFGDLSPFSSQFPLLAQELQAKDGVIAEAKEGVVVIPALKDLGDSGQGGLEGQVDISAFPSSKAELDLVWKMRKPSMLSCHSSSLKEITSSILGMLAVILDLRTFKAFKSFLASSKPHAYFLNKYP